MDILKKIVDKQVRYNSGKNLFYHKIIKSLKFSPETMEAISKLGSISIKIENQLIDYLTNCALQEFCRINQYYAFDKFAKNDLRDIYVELFENIKHKKLFVDSIAQKHYKNLISWLKNTNSFSEQLFASHEESIKAVACSEYRPELQLQILQLDIDDMCGPVLDIGCGKNGNLVAFLRQNDIDAYGFDRFADSSAWLSSADWFEYEYGINKWAIITSNLGFSNHFKHHHLRNDGNFINYAKKYIGILKSLKIGGCFHYAPDLPFIEQYLDKTKYHLTKKLIGEYSFQSVKIERLK